MQTLLLPDRICLTGSSLQICFLLSVMPGFNPSTNQSIAVEQTFSYTMQFFIFPLAYCQDGPGRPLWCLILVLVDPGMYVQQTDCISCCCYGIHQAAAAHISIHSHTCWRLEVCSMMPNSLARSPKSSGLQSISQSVS